MEQLVLSLSTEPRQSFEDLIIHDGIEVAVSSVKSVYGTKPRPLPTLFLHGVPGAGKTHILKALESLLNERSDRGESAARFIRCRKTRRASSDLERLVSEADHVIEHLAGVLIDDVHEMGARDTDHIWNVSNKLIRSGAPLALSARESPEEVFGGDPHLTSRINSGLVFPLAPPDDGSRILILDKMARDRNIRISQDVCRYIVTHKSRNVKDLESLLSTLDRASLLHKRRVTIPFIKLLEADGTI